MKSLDEIILKSKKKIMESFFKIVKNDDDSYSIIEYFGPKKSLAQMMKEGYKRFESLKNELNETYPIFDINDFKAIDENTLIKKTENDLIKEELVKYLKYYELSPSLYSSVKKLKELLISLSIKYVDYNTFSELQNTFNSSINSRSIEGSKYLTLFSTCVENVYLQMEKINISSPRDLFDKNFNYFIALIR